MSQHSGLLAARYAKALFSFSKENNALENTAQELSALKEAIELSPALLVELTSPLLSRAALAQNVRMVAKAAAFSRETSAFFERLALNRRFDALLPIIDAFLDLWRAERGEVIAFVEVAKALSPKQREALVAVLSKESQKKVQLKVTENPALLGGVRVRLGSLSMDASLSGALTRVSQHLKAAAPAA